jgi:hypothetical protein
LRHGLPSCQHALAPALAAAEALNESGNRSVRPDRQACQYIRRQHIEVAAPETLNPNGFFEGTQNSDSFNESPPTDTNVGANSNVTYR